MTYNNEHVAEIPVPAPTAPKDHEKENKFQPSLLPMDLLVPMLEPAYREGVLKYHRESWRNGFNATVMYDALRRHLDAWFYELESYDPESMEKFNIEKHHLGAVIFCVINLYNTEMNFPHLDDRPLKILEKYNETQRLSKQSIKDSNLSNR
jgi:hypothetical protein